MIVKGYNVIRVAEGAVFYECEKCGAIVFHPTRHECWHVAQREIDDRMCILIELLADTIK